MAMSQNRLAAPTWSYAMEVYPPDRIIEIGTGDGGLTTCLGLHAKMIGAKVISYDRKRPNEIIEPIARGLGVDFRLRLDIWAHQAEVASLIASPGRVFLLCDGGDKKREFATFAKFLKPGDLVASHDYDAIHEANRDIDQLSRYWPWSEIQQKDVADTVASEALEPFLQEHFDYAGWLVYRKR